MQKSTVKSPSKSRRTDRTRNTNEKKEGRKTADPKKRDDRQSNHRSKRLLTKKRLKKGEMNPAGGKDERERKVAEEVRGNFSSPIFLLEAHRNKRRPRELP